MEPYYVSGIVLGALQQSILTNNPITEALSIFYI